jgi:phosphohistidine phosphatase
MPLRLFLVRHAHALDGLDDAARPLSAKGRAQVKRLGKFLRASGAFAPDEIWHSPLVRARDTAALLARALRSAAPLRAVTGLRSADDPRRIARRLAKTRRALALVGHEPHLSALASLLVAGEAEPPILEMKKCAVLALERDATRWVVRWQVSPELLA